jgi:protein-disulfide isomerase
MNNTAAQSQPQTATDADYPPEAALTAGEHNLGNTHALLSLLEYGDYECPACIRAEAPTQRLIEVGGSRMSFSFRHFPWVTLHSHALLAAEAAEAAAAQGKFWQMHHLLFAQRHGLGMPALTRYAKSIELDMIRFKAEMADRVYTQRIQEHLLAGEDSGVTKTPSYFLNGHQIDVSHGFEKLEDAVHAALTTH